MELKEKKRLANHITSLRDRGYNLEDLYSDLYAEGYESAEVHEVMNYVLYHPMQARLHLIFAGIAGGILLLGFILMKIIL